MSATWVRAQAFGQPLMLTVMSTSKSASRFSSVSTSSAARALVSTIASLQNSMPVQAIVPRRQVDGRASQPDPEPAPATSDSTWSACHVQHDQLLLGGEPHPAAAVRLDDVGHLGQLVEPLTRPATGGDADVDVAVPLRVHADVVDGGPATPAPGHRSAPDAGIRSPAPRGTAPTPQSATRNFSRARLRSRR